MFFTPPLLADLTPDHLRPYVDRGALVFPAVPASDQAWIGQRWFCTTSYGVPTLFAGDALIPETSNEAARRAAPPDQPHICRWFFNGDRSCLPRLEITHDDLITVYVQGWINFMPPLDTDEHAEGDPQPITGLEPQFWFGTYVWAGPKDFNMDGRVNSEDLMLFRMAFDSGDMRADYDRSGTLTFYDFLVFTADWPEE